MDLGMGPLTIHSVFKKSVGVVYAPNEQIFINAYIK